MDRYDFYYLQLLSEGELDGAFDRAELADQAIVSDFGLVGVAQALTVAEHNPTPDLTVDAATGTAYDPNGQRMRVPSLQVVDMSVDYLSQSTAVVGGGNTNILALFLFADRALSDPRIDGNSNQVFFQRDESFDFKVVQSGESASPSPPALESDKILLADITLSFGTTQIVNAIISTARRQDAFVLSAGALAVATGTPEESDQAILTELNNHITSVSNLHPATAIDYAGGTAWHDGTTNPADDVEATLDNTFALLAGTTTGLASQGGSDSIGAGALTAWLGGRTRPLGSVWDQLEAVGVDLSAQTAADDGVERIGAEAHTAAGNGLIDLTLGSGRSQLNELSDAAAAHALNQTISGNWTFAGGGSTVALAGVTTVTGSFILDRNAAEVIDTVEGGPEDRITRYYDEDTDVPVSTSNFLREITVNDGDVMTYRARVHIWGKGVGLANAGYWEGQRTVWKDSGTMVVGSLVVIHSELAAVGATATVVNNGNASLRVQVAAGGSYAVETAVFSEVSLMART